MGENWGRSGRILTPNELDLTLWVPNHGAKFHQNRARIATVGESTDRQTHVTDASEFIICPMLCYSNGTDNQPALPRFGLINVQIPLDGHG